MKEKQGRVVAVEARSGYKQWTSSVKRGECEYQRKARIGSWFIVILIYLYFFKELSSVKMALLCLLAFRLRWMHLIIDYAQSRKTYNVAKLAKIYRTLSAAMFTAAKAKVLEKRHGISKNYFDESTKNFNGFINSFLNSLCLSFPAIVCFQSNAAFNK